MILLEILGRKLKNMTLTPKWLEKQMNFSMDDLPVAGTILPMDYNGYWQSRKHEPIYKMTIIFSEMYCSQKMSVADIGCHCSPMVLLIPNFNKRFAIDPSKIAKSCWEKVDGAKFIQSCIEKINIKELTGNDKFDLITCHQVIEHLQEPQQFCSTLLDRCRRLIISTTFETPAGLMTGHIQDPISLEKFEGWFYRKMIVALIFRGPRHSKILAVF